MIRKTILATVLALGALLVDGRAGAQDLRGNVYAAPSYGIVGFSEDNAAFLGWTAGGSVDFGHVNVHFGLQDYGFWLGKPLTEGYEKQYVQFVDAMVGYRLDLWNRLHVTPSVGPYLGIYDVEDATPVLAGVGGSLRIGCDLFWRIGIFAEGVGRFNAFTSNDVDWKNTYSVSANAGLYFRL